MINLMMPRKVWSYSPYYKKLIPQETHQFFAPKGKFLILAFLKTSNGYDFFNSVIRQDIGIVCVTSRISRKIQSPNIVYVEAGLEWFNPLIINKSPFKGLYTDTHFIRRSGYFHDLYKVRDILDIYKLHKKWYKDKDTYLFDIDGGLGDNLMTIPTLKTYASKGKKILVKTKYPEVFENLDYVKIARRKFYGNYFYLNFGSFFSDYTKDLNKRNRIYAIGDFCGLSNKLIIKKPEIILTEEEKNKFKEYGKKTFFGITTNRPEANLPLNIAQKIIDNAEPDTFVSASKETIYLKGTKLFKDLTIRDLFSLIYNCKEVITVDTSFLHIAGALNKPITLLANGLIPPEWRTSTYDNVKVIEPKELGCYPCVNKKFVERGKRMCNRTSRLGECYYHINLKEII